MRTCRWIPRAFGTGCAVAILSACGAGASQPFAPPSLSAANSTMLRPIRLQHPWMDAQAKTTDLLYVTSQNTNTISVYSYSDAPAWKPRQIGLLTGTGSAVEPLEGECVDKSQNVYVTAFPNANGSKTNKVGGWVFVYAHGGARPIRKIVTAGDALGCAFDPTNGDLTVLYYNTGGPNPTTGGGAVAVYKTGVSKPTLYTASACYQYTSLAYDPAGNLFLACDVPGSPSWTSGFAELPKGSTTFEPIQLNAPEIADGYASLFSDGKHIMLSDASRHVVYRLAITAGHANPVEKIALGNTSVSLSPPFAGDFMVPQLHNAKNVPITPEIMGVSVGSNAIFVWRYPHGGLAIKSITEGIDDPSGIALSQASN